MNSDFNRMHIASGDLRQWNQGDQQAEELKKINSLESHAYYLQKQLDRILTANPEMQDYIQNKNDLPAPSKEQLEDQDQIAQLINNSTLIKSYEQVMQQYEVSLEQKTKLIL